MPHKRNGFIIIFMTAPSKKEACAIITSLIHKRLVACGSSVSGVDSIYRWRSKIERAREVLVILKTRESLFTAAAAEIERLHSYEVPEIIAVPVAAGSEKYLAWVNKNVSMR